MADFDYDAFISYRRSDGGQVARWLRRELQAFRMPKALRGTFDRRLRIYLDTAYERGTSDFYEHSIKPALLGSRFLIVLATPDAVQRAPGADDWVQREVADFATGRHRRNVVAVRAAGEFSDPLPADLAVRFPNIEIVDLRGASRLAFLNPLKASRLANEKLKLIAPLVELAPDAMPRLRQEEERQQRMRLGAAAGVSLAVLTAVSATSIFALRSSFLANRALDDSMYATGRMVISIATASRAADAATETRTNMLNQGCDLLDKLSEESSRKPELPEVVVCARERALAHENLGELEQAKGQLQGAIKTATERNAGAPTVAAAQAILDARKAFAELQARQKVDAVELEQLIVQLRDEAERLSVAHDNVAGLVVAQVDAIEWFAESLSSRGMKAEAGDAYVTAADALAKTLSDQERDLVRRMVLLRLAAETYGQANDKDKSAVQIARTLAVAADLERKPMRASTRVDIAQAYAVAYLIYRFGNDASAASEARSKAEALLGTLADAPDAASISPERVDEIKTFLQRALTAAQ